ncbi:peroxidase 30 [Quercus suber]|uniref:peroxidase n=1 Tax=Quercus suber TaxID=58331 RepID=A0AAW0JLA1_QUESU
MLCFGQGGPFWRVPTGRRDGTISNRSEALNNIPPPTGNFSTLQRLFSNQGLDLTDLVLLSESQVLTPLVCLIVHHFQPACIISLVWVIRTQL